MNTATVVASNGTRRSAAAAAPEARCPNAITNVARYNANGTTHISGTAAMSVEIYVVTPSIRLDGMNASMIHRMRCAEPITMCDGMSPACDDRWSYRRVMTAHVPTSNARTTNAAAHTRACG